jgi:CheY-like chemotaxis protein
MELLNKHYAAGHVPNLIVLDINMPKMNGAETLNAIKMDERFKHIPVVIYSTSINPVEKDRCLSLGAHSYMIKPSSLKESLTTAKAFIELCELPENTGK